MTIYNIGTGISEVTDPAVGLGMQGMADPGQKTTDWESRLYSRTFIVADRKSGQRVVIVVVDIWTGTEAVKSEVIRRLDLRFPSTYNEMNVLISGTHTHSAPGGFSSSKLYENTGGGFDSHTFECIVSGIVASIQKAHQNLAPGKIYINKGTITDCGRQRSLPAYQNNPLSERRKHGSDTDKEMLLLKFVTLDRTGELPIGVLNWYAIHPTDRGQKNTLVSGDNKGFASSDFEDLQGTNYTATETFVAAFANSNCGDVSGNVEFGGIPDGISDKQHMELHGRKQSDKAKELFDNAVEELQGDIAYLHRRVNMSNVAIANNPGQRTLPAALGLSFAAGSKEDSVPRIAPGVDSFDLREGLVEGSITPTERAAQGVIISGLAATFGTTDNSPEFVSGHLPKPIVLAPGLISPPITPHVLPLQIIRIGTLALTAVPGELSTMAGRRLRETVLNELKDFGVNHLALATYANDYAQYITTKEEYDKQHYEGASTLFGPHTLAAYQQEFLKLARALKHGDQFGPGPNPPAKTAPAKKRITIRNLSSSTVNLKFYKQSDEGILGVMVPFDDLDIPANRDLYYALPNGMEAKARLNERSRMAEHIRDQKLVTIARNRTISVSNYNPPHPSANNVSTIGRIGPPFETLEETEWLRPILHIMMS